MNASNDPNTRNRPRRLQSLMQLHRSAITLAFRSADTAKGVRRKGGLETTKSVIILIPVMTGAEQLFRPRSSRRVVSIEIPVDTPNTNGTEMPALLHGWSRLTSYKVEL